MKPRIYFDNAATTALCEEALQEMLPYLTEQFGNPSSIHSFGRTAKAAIEKARKIVAGTLNCATSEIYFTGSGTESNNTVLKGAVQYLGVQRIITSAVEHHCVLHSAEYLQSRGTELQLVTIDKQGRPDLQHLENLLSRSGKKTLVSLMHANNELGTITNIKQVGELCEKYAALFHSDTVQTIGYFPIDLQDIKVHFISGSAHKFHGPKGCGFMYIRSGTLTQPMLHGGAQERNMRAGTENVSGIVGLGKALQLAIDHLPQNREHVLQLKQYAMHRLKEIMPDVAFNGDTTAEGSNYKVLSVLFPPHTKAELLLFNLDMAGIAASGGSACSSGAEKGSHVLMAIGADPNRKAIRFSFSKFNTRQEVDILIAELAKLFAPSKTTPTTA